MAAPDPEEFARSWVAAWNAHDLDAVLDHFADDVVFTSPVAVRVAPETAGRLVGRAALRDYWRRGLALIPDLHFEVLEVYAGLEVLVVRYRNHVGGVVCEVLRFRDGLVVEGHGTYLGEDPAGASGIRR